MGHLKPLDFAVISLYMGGMLFIGWWCSRRQNSTEEYFVSSRGIHPFIAGISIIATLVSTISYVAMPGEMIKNGPGWMWQTLHAPISFFVIGYFVIPRIMAHRVTSGYELLEQRFGLRVRQAAAVLFIFSRIFWMGLVIYSCSFAVTAITGLPLHGVLIAVGLVATFYTVQGGIRAVMVTDVAQFMILFGGALLTIAFISIKCGGVSEWWPDWTSPQLVNLHWPETKVLSLNPFDRVTVASLVCYGCSYWILTAAADQVVIQRFLSTRDAASARRSFGLSLVGDFGTSLVLYVTGMALVGFFLRFPEHLPRPGAAITQQADELFPHFIAAVLPQGLTGLVVSALFAAAMSSLDSGINSISTVLVTDFERVFLRGRENDDARRLAVARAVSVAVGCVAIAMSFGVSLVPGSNLLEVTVRVSSLLAAPLFVTFVLAFFVKFSTPAGAWAGMIAGACSAIGMTYWQQIISLFTHSANTISITLIMPLSALCAFAAGVVVSRFTRPRPQEEPACAKSN